MRSILLTGLLTALLTLVACKKQEAAPPPPPAPEPAPAPPGPAPAPEPPPPPPAPHPEVTGSVFPRGKVADFVARKIVAVTGDKVAIFSGESSSEREPAVEVYVAGDGLGKPERTPVGDPAVGPDVAAFAAKHEDKIAGILAGFTAKDCTPFDAKGMAGKVRYDAKKRTLTQDKQTIKLDNGGVTTITARCAVELDGGVTMVLVDYDGDEVHSETVEWFTPGP